MNKTEIRRRIRVDPETDCWIWHGARNDMGYGHVAINGQKQYIHRLIYQSAHGKIPDGLEIDHLCRNPICCNVAHLEAVTHGENLRRGQGNQYRNATHCVRGHAFVGSNFYSYWDKANGWYRRICRLCQKVRDGKEA